VAELLQSNHTLLELDLSWNYIREESALAVGRALRNNMALTALNLSYNTVSHVHHHHRHHHPPPPPPPPLPHHHHHHHHHHPAPTSSLATQSQFGHLASQEIGNALLENTTLTKLNLAYNSVTPKGAWVLAAALSKNPAIRELNMDGNRVGRRGGADARRSYAAPSHSDDDDHDDDHDNDDSIEVALVTMPQHDGRVIAFICIIINLRTTHCSPPGSEALLSAVRRCASSTRSLVVTMRGCDCDAREEGLFDPMEPTGVYTLDMTEPYGRMILNELMRLATDRAGCRIQVGVGVGVMDDNDGGSGDEDEDEDDDDDNDDSGDAIDRENTHDKTKTRTSSSPSSLTAPP
jgi:hypothetical protein